MRISLNSYVTDPLLPQKDGVNLAHENITEIFKQLNDPELEVTFHDFNRIISDTDYAKAVLTTTDMVFSNVGPHAHYYFYLRHQLRLDFVIIRDIRTALWSSYLFQEHLCQPYLKANDVLMGSSNYVLGIYNKIFPHLAKVKKIKCYPLMDSFPKQKPVRKSACDLFVIGYLGRLSEDKNFPDLIKLLIKLNKQAKNYKMIACGDVHSETCDPDSLKELIANELGSDIYFEYRAACNNDAIWDILSEFDLMIFPSTSNLETFGRVLIEASYMGIPVIASDHAAAPELIPKENLFKVNYHKEKHFETHFDYSLGKPNIADIENLVISRDLKASDSHLGFRNHPNQLIEELKSNFSNETGMMIEELDLSQSQRYFIDGLKVDMPLCNNLENTNKIIKDAMGFINDLLLKNTPKHKMRIEQLRLISKFPLRTEKFLAKLQKTNGDITNVGGIDIELCHLAKFYPTFTLS